MTDVLNDALLPPLVGELGGDCLCGRGPTIGTLSKTAARMLFRAFHDGATPYHLENAADWACIDCLADAAMAVATGEVRERMRQTALTKPYWQCA